jgi:ABC-type xylose transport system substrate-binding protein
LYAHSATKDVLARAILASAKGKRLKGQTKVTGGDGLAISARHVEKETFVAEATQHVLKTGVKRQINRGHNR